MKVWITKYALTEGIFTVEVEEPEADGIVAVRSANQMTTYYHGEGRDWHRTEESARRRAYQMCAKKLAALEKAKTKLLTMVFFLNE